jgi:hypothetical protein
MMLRAGMEYDEALTPESFQSEMQAAAETLRRGDHRLARDPQVNERVGHEHAGGVQHVRVAFAIRHDQQVILTHRDSSAATARLSLKADARWKNPVRQGERGRKMDPLRKGLSPRRRRRTSQFPFCVKLCSAGIESASGP